MKLTMILLLLIFFSSPTIADEYECPQLPIIGKIGDEIGDGWWIDFQSDGSSQSMVRYILYRHILGKQYRMNSWFGMNFLGLKQENKSLMQCCSFSSKKDVICVSKFVNARSCKKVWGSAFPGEWKLSCSK